MQSQNLPGATEECKDIFHEYTSATLVLTLFLNEGLNCSSEEVIVVCVQ
jgi:hypothetical protein